MSRLKLFIPLLLFVLLALFFYVTIKRIGQGDYDPQNLPSALVNRPFPSFLLTDLLNEQRQLSQQDLIGDIALVNVWATWCPSCYAEHQFLNQLSARGVVIIGINYKDQRPAARQWLEKGGDPYQLNVFDPEGRLGLDMGVTGAPETYVIDHRGFVRLRYQGPLDERVWQEHFQALLSQLEEERAQAMEMKPSSSSL